MEKIGFFATCKILLFLSLKTLDSDPPMRIHNLSFNNNYQNDLEFLITMSDPDLVQNFLFIVYRTHYLKCTVEVRNLRSDFFIRLLEKKEKM